MRESLKLRRTAAPQQPPVSLGEARAHLRLDADAAEEDAVLANSLQAAVDYCERWTGRALITQSFELFLDRLPNRRLDIADGPAGAKRTAVFLPRPPLQAVTSVSAFDGQGAETILPATSYFVDSAGEPGRVIFDSVLLPGDLRSGNRFRIHFDAGYGDASHSVPESLRQGILRLCAHLFEERGTCGLDRSAADAGALTFFAPFRVVQL